MFDEIVKFIKNLYGNEDFIQLHRPKFNGNEKKYLIECIDTTFVSSVGKFVNLFEEKIAKYTGSKYAVAAVNGTSALHIALMLAGVKPDDEVITQALSFIATANAIAYTGAKPVFVDVDKDTLGLSDEKLQNFLKKNAVKKSDGVYNVKTNRRISAIVPMHTFGNPLRIDKIKQIADEYGIPVVEDAAESLGSFYKNKHTGTFGLIGILSFNGNKTITTGGGGMIITDNEQIAKLAKHLTTQAKIPHKWEYKHDYIGYNYRLTNIAAALGVAQMEQLDFFIEQKRKLHNIYADFFKNTPDIQLVSEIKEAKSNYWLNAIILQNKKERDSFLEYSNNNGVMTRPIWELLNRLKMFNDCQTDSLTNSQWLADRVVNIPSSVI